MTGVVLDRLFGELCDDPAHAVVTRAREQGRRAIGYACSFVPAPLLSVEGIFAQRLRAPGTCGTPLADTYLSSVGCSYPRSVLEQAMDGRLDHIDGWVMVSSCDPMRRMVDNLRYLCDPRFCVMLDLPHKKGPHAEAWYAQELRRLAQALSKAFGVDTSDDALRASIRRHNAHLATLRALSELRKKDPPPMSGADFHRIVVASFTAPEDSLRSRLDAMLASMAEASGPEKRTQECKRAAPRLLVVGSCIDDPRHVEVVESVGGVVVADRHCFGCLPGLEPIAEDGDPAAAMAAHALRTTQCPRMMGAFEERVAYLMGQIRAWGADGVVLETMKFCDLWGVEGAALVAALRDAGVPVLRLEREYAGGNEGQLRTRVQAFLEAMGR